MKIIEVDTPTKEFSKKKVSDADYDNVIREDCLIKDKNTGEVLLIYKQLNPKG